MGLRAGSITLTIEDGPDYGVANQVSVAQEHGEPTQAVHFVKALRCAFLEIR